MSWIVEFHEDFVGDFSGYSEAVQDELLAKTLLLKKFGPSLGRPHVDTLRGSAYSNMKELRFEADDGIWRVAFAFDPLRNAILLTAGDKKGKNEKRFYNRLIKKADARFRQQLIDDKNSKKDGNSDSKGPGGPSKRKAEKNKSKGK